VVEKDSTEVVSDETSEPTGQQLDIESYNEELIAELNRIEPTKVVSSASAPKHDAGLPHPEIAGIEGLRKLAGLDGQPHDSSPPPLPEQGRDTNTPRSGDHPSIPQTTADEIKKNMGNDRLSSVNSGSFPDSELLESLKLSRVRIPGETKSACKERLRMLARNAGLPRGTGPGTAYEWAMNAVIELFAPPPPAPVIESEMESPIGENTEASASPIGEKLPVDPIPVAPIAPSVPPVVEPDVPGLGTIPESWPKLPANAPLQVEIAWVSANRLVVRSGKGVDLSRALSPAPSYSALSWLETSILFPSKFADISVKATVDQDTEKELVKREKMAIEEIRSLLREMLEPK